MKNDIGRNNNNGIFAHNSTKIFRELIMQYREKRDEGKKISKQLLIKNLQNKLKNIDCNEKDFIIRETRRNIKIKNKILENFGDKSLFHIDKANKIDAKIKIEKSKLLNPFLDYKTNEPLSYSTKNKNNDKHNSHKFIEFPKIINRAYTNKELKSFENKNINDSNSMMNRSNNESCTPTRKYFSPTKDDSKDSSNNYYLNLLSESNVMSKKKSSPNILPDQLKTPLSDRSNSSFNNKSKNYSISNIGSLINMDYINYMQSMKDKFLLDEQKKKKYFEYNKYGCDRFKLKYKYLKENYFN